jgi:hypothetical protein
LATAAGDRHLLNNINRKWQRQLATETADRHFNTTAGNSIWQQQELATAAGKSNWQQQLATDAGK